jgi:hypothetical protein
MLAHQPAQRAIKQWPDTPMEQLPGPPMGKFTVAGRDYLWRGDEVIRGRGRTERVWRGPYLQRLITEIMRQDHRSRESVQRILDTLEQRPAADSTVRSTNTSGVSEGHTTNP